MAIAGGVLRHVPRYICIKNDKVVPQKAMSYST